MEERKKNKFGINLFAVIIAFVFGLTVGQVDFESLYTKTPEKISRSENARVSTVEYKAPSTSHTAEALPTEWATVIIQKVTEENSDTVYRTPTGKRYHLDSYCAGVNFIESTVEESEALGLTPCKKCAGG